MPTGFNIYISYVLPAISILKSSVNLLRQISLKTWPGLSCQNICLDLKFQVNPSKNEDFRTRGQNQPLTKPCRTPGRNKVCQNIPYQKICLDLKFRVNLSMNKDILTRGQNQPPPLDHTVHPVDLNIKFQVNFDENKDFMASR